MPWSRLIAILCSNLPKVERCDERIKVDLLAVERVLADTGSLPHQTRRRDEARSRHLAKYLLRQLAAWCVHGLCSSMFLMLIAAAVTVHMTARRASRMGESLGSEMVTQSNSSREASPRVGDPSLEVQPIPMPSGVSRSLNISHRQLKQCSIPCVGEVLPRYRLPQSRRTWIMISLIIQKGNGEVQPTPLQLISTTLCATNHFCFSALIWNCFIACLIACFSFSAST